MTDLNTSDAVRIYGWENGFDTIVATVWERWTKNGLNMDADEREETTRSVQDAVTNEYTPTRTDDEWIAASLARLGGADVSR